MGKLKNFLNSWKIIIGLVALLSGGYLYLVKNVIPTYLKEIVPVAESMAQEYINGSVKIGQMQWDGGLSARIYDVELVNAKKEKVATLPETVVTFKPWRIIQKKERVLSSIDINKPTVYLTMDEKERWNTQGLLKESQSEETPFYGLLKVNDALLKVKTGFGAWDYDANAFIDGQGNPKFDVNAKVVPKFATSNELAVKGLVTSKGEGEMTITSKSLDLAPYAPATRRYGSVEELVGEIKGFALRIENNIDGKKQVNISGETTIENIKGKLHLNGEKYAFSGAAKLKAADSILSINSLDAEVEGYKAHLVGEADLHDIKDPDMKGLLTSEKLIIKNETLEKLEIPFSANKRLVTVDRAKVKYGEGMVGLNATVGLEEKAAAVDLLLDKLSYVSNAELGPVSANGAVALVARQGEEGLKLHMATEALALQWRNLKLDKLAFDGKLKDKVLAIEHASVTAEGGNMVAKGSVNMDNKALALKGHIADFPIDPCLEMAGIENGKGQLSTRFDITGTVDKPEFEAKAFVKNGDILGQKFADAMGIISAHDNIIGISKFRADMEQGKHILNGVVNLQGEEPVLDLKLETTNVRVEPLMVTARKLTNTNVALTGNLDNYVEIKGALSKLLVNGKMNLTDGSAQNFYLIDQIQGVYRYNAGRVRMKDFTISSLGSKATLNGVLTRTKRILDFNVDIEKIDLSRLPIQEKGVTLAGFLSAKGHLGGTLGAPLFEGDIAGNEVEVNGESWTDLKAEAVCDFHKANEFKVAFYQPIKNALDQKGSYTGTFNLDLDNEYMAGKILVHDGDIPGLLRTAKQKLALEGKVDAEVEFCPKGKGSGITMHVLADELKIHKKAYKSFDFKGSYNNQTLVIDDALLQETDSTEKGTLEAKGLINIGKETLKLQVKSNEIDPTLITAVMSNPPEISGGTNMNLDLEGSYGDLRQLKGEGKVKILKGSIAGVAADEVSAELKLANDVITLENLVGNRDVHSVSAKGTVPLDVFRDAETRYNSNAEMNIAVDLNNARLGILGAIDRVEWANGDIKGELNIGGTLQAPKVLGSIKIDEGNLKLKGVVSVIDKIKLDAVFNGSTVDLKECAAEIGGGKLEASGNYGWQNTGAEEYNLKVGIDNVNLVISNLDGWIDFKGRINSQMEIKPEKFNRMEIAYSRERAAKEAGKTLQKREGPAMTLSSTRRFNRPWSAPYRPAIFGNLRLDDVNMNIHSVPEVSDEESGNYGLHMKFELGPRIHLYNPYFYDIWASGGLNVEGSTLIPVISGKLKAEKGTVTYLRTRFKLTETSLSWGMPGQILPEVRIESTARFSRYYINLNITGPADVMEMKLTSNPPLEDKTLRRMLTLQRDSAGSDNVTGEDVNNLMTAGLEMAVLGNVEMFMKQNVGLDQFRLYSGKVRTGVGFENSNAFKNELTEEEKKQYNILVGKYINDKILLGYTTSFDNDHNSIFTQYEFDRNLNFTYSRSKEMDKKDNWFGLEYRLSF